MDERKNPQEMKQAWIIGLEQKVRKKRSTVCDSAFFHHMKPIIIGFFVFGRLPFSINKQGKMGTKIFHVSFLYWIFIFLSCSYLAVDDFLDIWQKFRFEKSFIRIVQHLLNFLILLFHFSLPFQVIFESKRICEYFNDWAGYEESYESLTDEKLTTKYNRRLRICVAATPFMVASILFYERNILFDFVWYHLVLYAFLFILTYLNVFFWYFSLVEIGNCATTLKNKLKWLLESAGNSIPFTLFTMIAINHASFVISAYVLISSLIEGNYEALQFLGIMGVTGTMIGFIMEAGHCASQKVYRRFLDTLMETDITDMNDKSLKEFNLFIKVVSKSDSFVTLSGYVNVNRPALAALLGSTVTYLIVLVQFNQSPSH